jgi:hypothetical protein
MFYPYSFLTIKFYSKKLCTDQSFGLLRTTKGNIFHRVRIYNKKSESQYFFVGDEKKINFGSLSCFNLGQFSWSSPADCGISRAILETQSPAKGGAIPKSRPTFEQGKSTFKTNTYVRLYHNNVG